MDLWKRVSVWSLGIGIVGCFLGVASGAVGVCGNGGWGVIAFLLGLVGLCVFAIAIAVLLVGFVREKWSS